MSNNQQQKVDWNSLRLGALWDKGNGKFGGTVTIGGVTRKIIGFPKREDNINPNAPDINLHFLPDDGTPPAQQQTNAAPKAAPAAKTAAKTSAPAPKAQVQTSDSDPLL